MAESRMQDVFDRLVTVSHGGDDGRILAAGLCGQFHPRSLLEDLHRGCGASGENESFQIRMGSQRAYWLSFLAVKQLQRGFWYAGVPEALHRRAGNRKTLRRRFQDHPVARRQGRRNTTHGNGNREVPG